MSSKIVQMVCGDKNIHESRRQRLAMFVNIKVKFFMSQLHCSSMLSSLTLLEMLPIFCHEIFKVTKIVNDISGCHEHKLTTL